VAHILEFHVGKQFSAGCVGDSAGQCTNVSALQDASVLYLTPSHPDKPASDQHRRAGKNGVQSIDFASVSSCAAASVGSSSAMMMANFQKRAHAVRLAQEGLLGRSQFGFVITTRK
jgi:hypothetical protein